VRDKILNSSEINFLCVHKKLRSKRLTPVLIKEITRRCYVNGIFQAVYTVGSLLPTPVSTCRYYHRALEWEKLHDVGFSPLPPNSTKQRQVVRYKLPEKTLQPGVRALEPKDTDVVLDLLQRYLKRMDMAQEFTKEEFEHWMFNQKGAKEQVVWAYVVEDPNTKKITDFFSFYNLESTVIGHKKHSLIKAAYLFYYATEKAFSGDENSLKTRLNDLVKDALILAKQVSLGLYQSIYEEAYMNRPTSMSSMHLLSSTTRSSSRSRSSVPVMAIYTTTSITTAPRLWAVASTSRADLVLRPWAELGWSCCRGDGGRFMQSWTNIIHCRGVRLGKAWVGIAGACQ
jgi:hypothetical protein